MVAKNVFIEGEIPYEKFQKIGIGKDSLLHMPREVLEPLLSGRITPLIEARVKADGGKTVVLPMKLQLMRDEEGKVLLNTYQVRKHVTNEFNLSEAELQRLKEGQTLLKETQVDGQNRMKYIQLDQETNSLLHRDVATLKMEQRLGDMEKINDIQLGTSQKQAAKEGKPVELTIGEEKVSVGVDLREPQGFKVVRGDMDEWRRQRMQRYDEANEGFMGYVQTDKNRWEYKQVVDHLEHRDRESVLREQRQQKTREGKQERKL